MKDEELLELTSEVVEWVGSIMIGSKDGGNTWNAVKRQPGAVDWFDTLKAAYEEIARRKAP